MDDDMRWELMSGAMTELLALCGRRVRGSDNVAEPVEGILERVEVIDSPLGRIAVAMFKDTPGGVAISEAALRDVEWELVDDGPDTLALVGGPIGMAVRFEVLS